MNVLQAANKYIPVADNRSLVTYPEGTTGDIIKEVLLTYRHCRNDLKDFAPYLKGQSTLQTAANIWAFVKKHISYKEDELGHQWIKTPARIWQDRFCDCKGYSTFIACILNSLDIPFRFRFVSFRPGDPTVTHVYIVLPGPTGEIYIDDVLGRFNQQKPYQYKQDFDMTQIARLSGIGCNCRPLQDGRRRVPLSVSSDGGTTTSGGGVAGIGRDYIGEIPKFKVPVNSLGYTTHDAISTAIAIERLQIEKGINQRKAAVAGIGALPTELHYDAAIQKLQGSLHRQISGIEGIGCVQEIGSLKSFFKKIGKGIKKVATVIKKVVTLPFTLPMKIVFETMLPNAAPAFLYIFIYPEYQGEKKVDLLNKVPDKVRNKAAKQKKLMSFIYHIADFKESHVVDKIRNGIMKKFGKQPETLIAERLGVKVSGVGYSINGVSEESANKLASGVSKVGGIWGVIGAAFIKLIQFVAKIFKKKNAGEGDPDTKDAVPDPSDFADCDSLTDPFARNACYTAKGNVAAELSSQTAAKEGDSFLEKVFDTAGAAVETFNTIKKANAQINPTPYSASNDNNAGNNYSAENNYSEDTRNANAATGEGLAPAGSGGTPEKTDNTKMLLIGGAALVAVVLLTKK